jgi:hypothetical protein
MAGKNQGNKVYYPGKNVLDWIIYEDQDMFLSETKNKKKQKEDQSMVREKKRNGKQKLKSGQIQSDFAAARQNCAPINKKKSQPKVYKPQWMRTKPRSGSSLYLGDFMDSEQNGIEQEMREK